MERSGSRDIHKQSYGLVKGGLERRMQATDSRNEETPKEIPTIQNEGGVGGIPEGQKQEIPENSKVVTAELQKKDRKSSGVSGNYMKNCEMGQK
jgi:hypothetical protein